MPTREDFSKLFPTLSSGPLRTSTEASQIARDAAEYAALQADAHGTKQLLRAEDIIDGDTSKFGRLTGFDTFESTAGIDSNEKARKLADLGLAIPEQQRLGKLGTHEVQGYLDKNKGLVATVTGHDVYGRQLLDNPQLAEHMVASGVAVPTDRYNEKLQNLARANEQKLKKLAPETAKAFEIQREYNIGGQKPGILDRVSESIDALQSGTQQALAGTADFALDLVTPGDNTWLNKAKSAEVANKVWGYDSREADFAKQEALHKFKKGEYAGAVGEMIKSPELWGESLPMMAEMMLGAGKFTALGKAIKMGTEGLSGVAKLEKAREIKNAASVFDKVKHMAAGEAGYLATIGDQSNRHIEAFTENNNGVPPTTAQIAGIVGLDALQLGLDRFAFTEAIGMKGGVSKFRDTIRPLLQHIPEGNLGAVASTVARTGAGLATAMGTEGAQEYLQTWAEMLNERAGTAKYGSWQDVLKSGDAQDQAIIGMLAGAGMGAQMRAPAEVGTILSKDNRQMMADTIKSKLGTTETGMTTEAVTPTVSGISEQKLKTRRSPDTYLQEISEQEAELKSMTPDGSIPAEAKEYLDQQRSLWTDVKSAVADHGVYKGLLDEVKTIEDPARKEYLNDVIKQTSMRRAKTLDEVYREDPEATHRLHTARNTLANVKGEGLGDSVAPGTVLDVLQATATLEELHENSGIPREASAGKAERVQTEAKNILKNTLTARMNAAGFQSADEDTKLQMLGDALQEWGQAAGVNIEDYRHALAKPMIEWAVESKSFGSGPKGVKEPASHASFDIDMDVLNAQPSVESVDQTELKIKEKVSEAVKKKTKDAKLFADEELQVEEIGTETHSGLSKNTINKLAEMFKIPAARVKSSLDVAFMEMQVRKMGDVSKESNKAQYNIYYGKDGIVPNYTKYKTAMETGDIETATSAINSLIKRYVDQAYKYMIALDSIKGVQEQIRAMPEDATLEDYTKEFAGINIGIQGATGSSIEYTVNGMDIVKLTAGVPQEIKDQIKLKAGGEVLMAIGESVVHLKDMFKREFTKEELTLPKISFKTRTQKEVQQLVADKLIAARKELKALEEAERSLSESDVAEDVIKSSGVRAELVKARSQYDTYIKELDAAVSREVKNPVQYTNTTYYKEGKKAAPTTDNVNVEDRLGQRVGSETAERAEKLGTTDAGLTIEEIEKLYPIGYFQSILDKIDELKSAKAKASVKIAEASAKVQEQLSIEEEFNAHLDSLTEKLDGSVKDTVKSAVKVAQDADKFVRNVSMRLQKLRKNAKELEAVQKFLDANQELFKGMALDVTELVKIKEQFDAWMKGKGRNATTAEQNAEIKRLADGENILDRIFKTADKIAKRAVVFARKLISGIQTYEGKDIRETVKLNIEKLTKDIERLEKKRLVAKDAQKVTTKEAMQQLKSIKMTSVLSEKQLKEVLHKATNMAKLKKQVASTKNVSIRIINEVNKRIKELEAQLSGTQLYKRVVETNVELVRNTPSLQFKDKSGNTFIDKTDYSETVKGRGTLLGQLRLQDIKTLLSEGSEERNLVESIVNTAMTTLKGSRLYTDVVPTEQMASKQIVENPALSILTKISTEGGNVKFDHIPEMVQALVLTTKNYLASNASTLAYNDAEAVSKILGVSEYDPLVKKALGVLTHKGRLLSVVAAQVGDDFARAMGIQQGKLGEEAYRKLVADLGNMGLILAEKTGDIEFTNLPAKEWNAIAPEGKQFNLVTSEKDVTVKFVHVKKDKVQPLLSNANTFKELNKVLGSLSQQSTYRTNAINAVKNKKVYKIKDSPFDAPEKSQEVLRHSEDQKYVLQLDGLKDVIRLYRDSKTMQPLMERAGWVDISSMTNQLKDSRDAQEGKNMEIETSLRKLDEMFTAYENGEISDGIFFNWFFSGNGRYMIDAIGVNPQADKHFSRWLVIPEKSSNIMWDMKDSATVQQMHEGIAQAFGFDIDSATPEAIETFAVKVLTLHKKDVKDFRVMVETGEGLKENGLKTPHLGHALQALQFMDKKVTAKGNSFRATLTAEYDAKTSGIMHKTMQAPVFGDKNAEYLSKGAIMINGASLDGSTSSEHVSKETDMYKTSALKANEKLEGLNGQTALKAETKMGDYKDAFKVLKKFTTVLVGKDGVITKEGRTLSKEAFIPFNYASSVNTIKKNIGMSMAYDILNHIVDDSKVKEHKAIKKIFGWSDVDFTKVRKELREKPAADVGAVLVVGSSKYFKLLDILVDMFTATYGESYKYSMESQFGEHVEMNEVIKDTTTALFGMWKHMYDKKIAGLPNPTVDEKMEVIRDLEMYFPLIKAPWSEGRLDGVAIFDTKRTSLANEVLPTVRTTTGKRGATTSDSVQAMILEMEKTFAAGAVLPIHWIDGTQIANPMSKDGIQGIHDAIALGLEPKKTKEAIYDMNKAMYDINRNYDMMGEFNLSLLRALEMMPTEELVEFTKKEAEKFAKTKDSKKPYVPVNLAKVKEVLGTMADKVAKAREELYAKPMIVGNIIAYEGTEYRSEVDSDNYKNLDTTLNALIEKGC